MQLKDLGNLSSILNGINSSNNIAEYFNSLDLSMQKCVLTSDKLSKSQLEAINSNLVWSKNLDGAKATVKGLSQAELEAAIKTSTLSTAQKGAAISTAGFTSALKGLWATMMANPLLIIGMAVTAGISLWSKYKQSVEESRQATAEAARAYGETSKSIDDYANNYSKLHDELTNANTSEERQHEIKSDLLSLQQELNDKYGDEYGKLNLVTDAYKDQTAAILAMNKAAAKNYLLENREEIDSATSHMEKERTYSLGSTGYMSNEYAQQLYDIVSQFIDQGIKLEQFNAGSETGYTIKFTGDAEQANKVIHDVASRVQELEGDFKDNNFVQSFLDNSANSLKENSKILDKYQDTYDKALMSQIASDDELSEGYTSAKNAVKNYNDAIASGDEKKILSARDDLNKVKDTINLTSSDWKKYGSVMNDVFNQADTSVYDFADDLKSNKDNLMTIVESLRGKKKEDILAMDDAENNDGFNKLKTAADKYGLSVDQVIDQLIKLNIVQGNVGESGQKSLALSKEEVISSVNSLSEGFESLDKIMSSMKGKNPFDFALLDDKNFKDSFSDLGESYTNFIETISDSPKDVKGAQSAFDDLTTAWIDSKLALNGYTEENANLIASMLKNMGVANAEEVVASRLAFTQEQLAAQKAYTAEMSDALANATVSEIPGLIDEATQSDIAKVALAGLALEKANANGTILDTSGDIENAIALINTIGSATNALVAYNKAKAGDIFDASTQKANLENLLSQRTGLEMSMVLDDQLNAYQEKMDNLKSAVDKEVQDAINSSRNYQGKGASANYAGANKSNKAGSDKKKKEETKNDIDWIARGTKVLQDEYAKLEELSNKDTVAYLGLTQEQFDNAKSIFDNGLGNTIDGLSQLQGYADKAGLSLGELYTMIQSGAPTASKENALQSMLKMQTETLLPQYQKEVEAYSKAYEDALKAIPSEYKDKIENGGVEIESLPSDLGKKVQTAIDANDKLKSSEKQLADGESEHIKTIKDLHENRISAINTENEKLEQSNKIIKSQMELMEARGEIIDADFYKQQKNNNKGLISGNEQDIAEWESEMADLRAAKVSVKSKDYKELQAKVRAAKNEVQGLRLEQEEINQALEQMPIDNLNTIVSMYKDISNTIENWGNVYSATGQKLNSDYFQTLISNGATTIDQYQELASEIRNVMDDQKEGSTRWNELYSQLQSVNSEMSSMVQNLQKWNEELLKMPLENINNYTSELQKVADGLSGVKSDYDTAISAVTGAITEQIKAINEQKDAVNEEYDAQKKALQDKLDLLNKQNKELQLQQKYEQALYNLQKANQQATEKVIRDGQVVYEQNADKLRDAQEAVQSAKFDMETDKIQTQIDELQETLDGLNEKYQDQIDSLQKISDKWSEISEKITQAQNEAKADELIGVGWKDKVLSGKDVELFNNFSGMYANTAEQLRQYQEQIDNTNNIYSLLEDYISSYKEGTLSYDQALTGINNLLAQMNQTMSAEGNLQNIYDYLGAMNGTAANAENVLSGIKQGLANTATELINSFKQYNQNAGLISEYTSSWQQLTDNVASMLNVLEEVRDNLENASEDDDDNDDEDGSPFRKGSSGYVNSGPGVAYKNGIENGLVGASSTSNREAKMKLLGLKKMDQDEISAILHKNEAVFNPEQQDILLKNLATAWNIAPSKINYSTLSPNRPNPTKQEFNFGDINIQECNNTEGLASGILNGGLKRAIIQQSGIR